MGEKIAERINEIETAYGVTVEFVPVAYSDAFATAMQQMEVTGAGGDIVFSTNNSKHSYTRRSIDNWKPNNE